MDLKIFGRLNILIVILGAAGLIIGILLATASLPQTDRCSVHPEDQDGIDALNGFTATFGIIALLAGVLLAIAGGLGACAGFSKNRYVLISSNVMISISLIVVGIVMGSCIYMSVVFSAECDKRTCAGDDRNCYVEGCFERGADSDNCHGWCKDHYDYLCDDLLGKFTAGAVFFALMLVTGIFICGCSCGACLCCKASFDMDEA